MHVHNENNVSFWNNCWIDEEPLKELIRLEIYENQMEGTVADYWKQGE